MRWTHRVKTKYTEHMNSRFARSIVALVLALAAGGAGYTIGKNATPLTAPNIPAANVSAPEAGTTRVLYSLDAKQNDKEIITLIDAAKSKIYFAIYTFTLKNIADALVAAKERGVAVYGVVDSGQAASSYGAPIIKQLVDAGIPVVTEKHSTGNGIMHLKTIVTESAYATGSYNWTKSGTTLNDEILEIGTDPVLRQTYENILRRLFEAYRGNEAAKAASRVFTGTYDYTDASAHIGEYAAVRGTLVKAHTTKIGMVFLDFCTNYKTCPFSGVIFADDAKKFGDLSRYEDTTVTLTGKISSYEGKAQIVLSNPSQLKN